MRRIVRFFRKIIRTLSFFPSIWDDEDYDYNGLFVIMLHRIKLTRKYFNTKTELLDSRKIQKELMVCQNLLQRLVDENYHMNLHTEFEREFGEVDHVFIESEHNRDLFEMKRIFKCNGAPLYLKEFHYQRMHDQAYKSEQQDLDLLFKYLRKNIKNWWD